MTSPHVVGIDPSLTSTGIATITPDGPITVHRVQSTGKASATLTDRLERLTTAVQRITLAATQQRQPDLIVIEGPAIASRQGSAHDRSGLWWLLVTALAPIAPIAEIPPTCRAKYATGKGNAPKDEVLAATVRRYPTAVINCNDEADALALAAMGARHLGHPIDDLPKTHLDAMTKVHWPNP